jgi:hypothetical protein
MTPYALYIAAPFQLREGAQILMTQLEAEGIAVTSSWLRGDVLSDEQAATTLDHLGDIDRSHGLVLLNPSMWADAGTGGRHFEAGYAFKGGKDLFICGARTQVFHYQPNVHVVTEPELLLPRLRMHLMLTGPVRR